MRFCFFFNVQAKEINEKEFKVLKAPLDEIRISPVVFENKDSGFKLAGTVFAPKTMKSDDKLPAIIVQGQWVQPKNKHMVKMHSHVKGLKQCLKCCKCG